MKRYFFETVEEIKSPADEIIELKRDFKRHTNNAQPVIGWRKVEADRRSKEKSF